jgi:hypothetical protein
VLASVMPDRRHDHAAGAFAMDSWTQFFQDRAADGPDRDPSSCS